MVNVPPYCGTPSLSHQLPFAEVVVTVVVLGTTWVTVVVDVVVCDDVNILVDVGVEVVQDVKTSDVNFSFHVNLLY